MANKVNQTLYTSGEKPKSSILKNSFINRLNSLFGFRTVKKEKAQTEFEKNYGMKFVRVDLSNDAYKVHQAALGSVYSSNALSSKLEAYFDAYLEETTLSYDDIIDRQKRINELSYMYYNDVFASRVVHLVADEATQLDVQDRIISIESPDIRFVNRTYELMNQWGITQQRTHAVCFDLELYGESFWLHKIGQNGIEKIKPLPVNNIMERLEFSPIHVAKYLAEKNGWQEASKNRSGKIAKLIDLISSKDSFDVGENLNDTFDDKLLGYELQGGIVAPPWAVTHFRYNSDHSEFYPYGRPPLLQCLAPFKQAHSTMALQGLARMMAFPVTMYKVKNTDGMLPADAFDLVNTVREQYDNLGVSPTSQGSEVYTVNTKIWVPDGLLDIDVKDAKTDYNFIEDLENYQKRVAIAAGVPLGFLDPTSENGGMSGRSLVQQYKPFARHVYTIQSSFLQGLGELIRMHYAITGEFDYNTPFVISMRFPAEEISDDKANAQKTSMEMAGDIIKLIKDVLGIEEDAPLPEDVVTDVLSKYSFLDPTDIQKWIKLSSFIKAKANNEDEEGGGDDGSFDIDSGGDDGGDFGGGDMRGEEPPPDEGPALESINYAEVMKAKSILRERKYREAQRMKELSKRYREAKESIFMRFIESHNFTEWPDSVSGSDGKSYITKHNLYVPKITNASVMYESFKVLTDKGEDGYSKLKENEGLKLIMKDKKSDGKVNLANDKKIKAAMKAAAKEAKI